MRLLGEVGVEIMTFAHSLKLDLFGSINEESSAHCPSLVSLSFILPIDALLDYGLVIHHFFVHGGSLLVITERVVGCVLGRQCFDKGNGWFKVASYKFVAVEAVPECLAFFLVGADLRIT